MVFPYATRIIMGGRWSIIKGQSHKVRDIYTQKIPIRPKKRYGSDNFYLRRIG
jgi:hypothetical protein